MLSYLSNWLGTEISFSVIGIQLKSVGFVLSGNKILRFLLKFLISLNAYSYENSMYRLISLSTL